MFDAAGPSNIPPAAAVTLGPAVAGLARHRRWSIPRSRCRRRSRRADSVAGLGVDARIGQQAPYPMTAVVTATDTSMQAVLTRAWLVGARVPRTGGRRRGRPGRPAPSTSLGARHGHPPRAARPAQRRRRAAAARPATAQYSGTTLTVQDLRLESGTTTADVSGALGPDAPVSRWRCAGRSPTWRRGWPGEGAAPDVTLGGTFDATLGATGPLDRLVLRGTLAVDQGRVEWTGYPAATGVDRHGDVENGVVSAPTIRGTSSGPRSPETCGSLTLLGDWLPPASRRAARGGARAGHRRACGSTTSPPRPWRRSPATRIAQGGLSGAVSLDIDLRADGRTLDQVSGVVQVARTRSGRAGPAHHASEPTRLDITGGLARIRDLGMGRGRQPPHRRRGQANRRAPARSISRRRRAGPARAERVPPRHGDGGVGDLALTVQGTASARPRTAPCACAAPNCACATRPSACQRERPRGAAPGHHRRRRASKAT